MESLAPSFGCSKQRGTSDRRVYAGAVELVGVGFETSDRPLVVCTAATRLDGNAFPLLASTFQEIYAARTHRIDRKEGELKAVAGVVITRPSQQPVVIMACRNAGTTRYRRGVAVT